jgi:sec-independent protein translocase protein TatA
MGAMFGLSLGHLLIVLVVVLLFGSRRLPELGSALGKGLRAFKRGMDGDSSERRGPGGEGRGNDRLDG